MLGIWRSVGSREGHLLTVFFSESLLSDSRDWDRGNCLLVLPRIFFIFLGAYNDWNCYPTSIPRNASFQFLAMTAGDSCASEVVTVKRSRCESTNLAMYISSNQKFWNSQNDISNFTVKSRCRFSNCWWIRAFVALVLLIKRNLISSLSPIWVQATNGTIHSIIVFGERTVQDNQ